MGTPPAPDSGARSPAQLVQLAKGAGSRRTESDEKGRLVPRWGGADRVAQSGRIKPRERLADKERMNAHPSKVSTIGLALLFALACSTPAKRVDERRALFEGYSPEVQASIRAGQVSPGMTEDAVWMALGDPNQSSIESTEAADVLIWTYTRSRPGFGVSIGGGSYGGASVGGGVGVHRPAEKDYQAVVHFKAGVVTYVRQATE